MSAATVATVAVVAGAASSAYAANQQNKQAKKAAKLANQPKTSYSTRTPYMNEYISQIAPYILESAQQVYGNRMKGYGLPALDFSKVQQRISNISPDYAGVGGPMDAGGIHAGGGYNGDPTYQGGYIPNRTYRERAESQALKQFDAEQPIRPTNSPSSVSTSRGGQMRGDAYDFDNPISNQYGREDTSNLDAAYNDLMSDPRRNFNGTGIDARQALQKLNQGMGNLLPPWLRNFMHKKTKGSSAGFSLGQNPL